MFFKRLFAKKECSPKTLFGHPEGTAHITDPRFFESKCPLRITGPNSGSYPYESATQDAELIATMVLGWHRCRSHFHDACDGTADLKDLVEGYHIKTENIIEHLSSRGLSILIEQKETDRNDPLYKQHCYYYYKVTVNGYEGFAHHGWDKAFWMALLNWAQQEQSNKNVL